MNLEIDPADPSFYLRPDYHDVLAGLRAGAPVWEYAPGLRTVARYDDIREISRDPARFVSGHGVLVNDPMRANPDMAPPTILHLDPPEHATYRKLVNREFTPRAVTGLEGPVRALARTLLAALPEDEPVDIVAGLSAPLPVLVIAELLGIPDADRSDFRRWSDAIIAMPDGYDAQQQRDATEGFAFLDQHVRAKAAAPGDDLVSRLTSAEVDGHRLSQQELVMFCVTLLVAGNETTRHLVTGALDAFGTYPDQWAAVVDGASSLAVAVEECLRWVTPIQTFAWTVAADTEVGGHPVLAGDYLVMLYASGNRDEEAFGATAGQFDVRRPIDPAHLAFGFGEHLCLGAALARLEARVLLGEVAATFPRFALAGSPTMVASTIVRGIDRLPVVLCP